MIMNALNIPGSVLGAMNSIRSFNEGEAAVSIQVSATGFLGLIGLVLLSGPINYGKSRMFLKQARDGEDMIFGDLFKGFYDDFGGNIVLALCVVLFTFLWSLLFVIPGIVKGYAYALVFYIKADHPDYDWKTCLNESQRLMQGKKGALFLLDLSFIGWYLVGALCLGVGTLWVAPYVEATKAHFYQNLLIADASGAVPPYAASPEDNDSDAKENHT